MDRRIGNTYDIVNLHDQAQAHLGDTIVHHHYNNDPQKDHYDVLLASLAFPRMDARLHNVAAALPTTCEWLRSHERFRFWAKDDHNRAGLLWVKGKPGSGKSTIMKETLAWAQKAWTGHITLAYFFNARATEELEKSSLGLYRSLLHQLLSASTSLRPRFANVFSSKVRATSVSRSTLVDPWTETEIQNFLIEASINSSLPPLNIFIDALDEGEEGDIRSLIDYFEDIVGRATRAGIAFRLCLSSRHYPNITIRRGSSIVLEDQSDHTRDIETYIKEKLHGDQALMSTELRADLRQRSGGVFLWVVLVIPMLNHLYDRGRGMVAMREKLSTIPQTLHDLFASLLGKDPDTSDECAALLMWVLFSMRPLSPLELYLAVKHKFSASASQDLEDLKVVRPDSNLRPLAKKQSVTSKSDFNIEDLLKVRDDSVLLWVLDCSRGLVEVTKGFERRVQFIHETVRGSLLTMHLLDSRSAQLRIPGVFNFETSLCHATITEVCLEYFLDLCCKNLPIDYNSRTHRKYFPFATYAARYWGQHMRAITNDSNATRRIYDLAMKLLAGDNDNLLSWCKFYDAEINKENPYGLNSTSSTHPTPIYFAALLGIPQLLERFLSPDPDMDASNNHYLTVSQTASTRGDTPIMPSLPNTLVEINSRGGRYGSALMAAVAGGHTATVERLLSAGADLDICDISGVSALELASRLEREEIIDILLDAFNTSGLMPSRIEEIMIAASNVSRKDSTSAKLDEVIGSCFPGNRRIELRISMLGGRIRHFSVWAATRGIDLKRMIEARNGELSGYQRLFIDDRRMRTIRDEQRLDDLNVCIDSRIHVLPELWRHRSQREIEEHPRWEKPFTENYTDRGYNGPEGSSTYQEALEVDWPEVDETRRDPREDRRIAFYHKVKRYIGSHCATWITRLWMMLPTNGK